MHEIAFASSIVICKAHFLTMDPLLASSILLLYTLTTSLALSHPASTAHPLHPVNQTHLSIVETPDVLISDSSFGIADFNLKLDDCRAAFQKLPAGEVPWSFFDFRYHGLGELMNVLQKSEAGQSKSIPTFRFHGTRKTINIFFNNIDPFSGSCELRLSISGQWAERNIYSIKLVPNDIRDMFSYVMTALDSSRFGGFTTRHLGRTIDWLLSPDIDFPQNPVIEYMRKRTAPPPPGYICSVPCHRITPSLHALLVPAPKLICMAH